METQLDAQLRGGLQRLASAVELVRSGAMSPSTVRRVQTAGWMK
jgi:hypothetical protein